MGHVQVPSRTAHCPTDPLVASTITDGLPDALIAQPGFSALVRVTTGGRERRILFDAGVTPTGVVENMRRLELLPGEIETIVLSHGHSHHVVGMEGIAKELGPRNLHARTFPEPASLQVRRVEWADARGKNRTCARGLGSGEPFFGSRRKSLVCPAHFAGARQLSHQCIAQPACAGHSRGIKVRLPEAAANCFPRRQAGTLAVRAGSARRLTSPQRRMPTSCRSWRLASGFGSGSCVARVSVSPGSRSTRAGSRLSRWRADTLQACGR
jgi:Metallo-beta-lactamase superfamily